MTEKQICISYEEYTSIDELSAEDAELARAALDAMQGSYAPYSRFNVGAAVKLSNGAVVKGANQENAAFPSGICAERTAMFAASSTYPDKAMVEIAVAGGVMHHLTDAPATPCGACRQVMAQYQTKGGRPMAVLLVGAKKIQKFHRVDDILPLIFDCI